MPTSLENNHRTRSSTAITNAALIGTSSTLASLLTAVTFHPWDRALYLSVTHNRPFLLNANFQHAWSGLTQSLLHRTISTSCYFYMQRMLTLYLTPPLCKAIDWAKESNWLNADTSAPILKVSAGKLLVGLSAGAFTGAIATPLYAVKYYSWNHPHSGFISSLLTMQKAGGYKPFTRALFITMSRDIIFGASYEVQRFFFKELLTNDKTKREKCPLLSFTCDALAGLSSTALAAPLNYVRNIQYSIEPHETPLGVSAILKSAWNIAQNPTTIYQSKWHAYLHGPRQNPHKPSMIAASHGLFFSVFKVGWGSARVGLGTAVTQLLFNHIEKSMTDESTSKTQHVLNKPR